MGHLCLSSLFSEQLVFEVLHIVGRVVLNERLWWRLGWRRSRALAGGAEDRGCDHQHGNADVDEDLEVPLQNPLRLRLVADEFLVCHDAYPFRVNSMRFLPSSTYPLSMTFGIT